MVLNQLNSNDSMTTLRLCGQVGIAIYGFYALVCLWRFSNFWKIKNDTNRYKLWFHGLLFCSASVDVIYYSTLAYYNSYVAWGYSFHTVALCCNILAFFAVMAFWSEILGFGGEIRFLKKVFLIPASVVNILYSIATILAMLIEGSVDGVVSSIFKSTLGLIFSLTLFLTALWMLFHGLKLRSRILTHHAKKIDSLSKFSDLFRLNFVICVCVLLYMWRAILLVYVSLLQLNAVKEFDDYTIFAWFIVSLWIPQLLPDYLLLYLMQTGRGQRLSQVYCKDNPNSDDPDDDILRWSDQTDERIGTTVTDNVELGGIANQVVRNSLYSIARPQVHQTVKSNAPRSISLDSSNVPLAFVNPMRASASPVRPASSGLMYENENEDQLPRESSFIDIMQPISAYERESDLGAL